MSSGHFISAPELAARLREKGIRVADSTVYGWASRYRIGRRIGGQRLFPQTIIPLLLEGATFAEIAERMRASEKDES